MVNLRNEKVTFQASLVRKVVNINFFGDYILLEIDKNMIFLVHFQIMNFFRNLKILMRAKKSDAGGRR